MPIFKAWKNSIFGRLFITFILVMVPIFILGYSIYNWGLNSIKYEITSSMQAKVNSYMQSLENEVQRMRGLQYNMFSDTGLTSLSLASSDTDDYQMNMDILRVEQGLDTIKTSSKYINEISAFIPSINLVIKSFTIRDMNENDFRLIETYSGIHRLGFNKWGDSILLNQLYPDAELKDYGLPSVFIQIEISKSELGAMLQEMQVYKGSGAFFLSRNNDIYIYNGADEKVGVGIKNQINKKSLPAKKASNIQDYYATVNNERYIVTYSISDIYDFSLAMYTPEDVVFSKVVQYRVLFLVFVIVSMIIIIIFSFSTHRFIHRPLSRLNSAFGKIEKGDMTVEINHKGKDEFRFIYQRFNTMVRNLNSLIDQVYLQKILVQKAELKQLQTQINPHFLYNSFFILHRWIKLGYIEDSVMFSEQLGEYFQYITRSSADEVPLCSEVGHARTYAEIQAIRFSNRIKIEFQDLPEEYKYIIVPRLIIQPVIENSFEHVLEDMESDGILTTGFEKNGNFFRIMIEDNGKLLTDARLEELAKSLDQEDFFMEITGIINIHRRIRLKYGLNSGVILSRGKLGGLKVTLVIELKEDAENVRSFDC